MYAAILLIIILILLLVVFSVASKDPYDVIAGTFVGALIAICIVVIIQHTCSQGMSTSEYSVKTQINNTYINDIEVSRDTVYIFTHK